MERKKNTILRRWLKSARKKGGKGTFLFSSATVGLEDFNIGFPIDESAKETKNIEVYITISNNVIDNTKFDLGQHIGEKLHLAVIQYMKKHHATGLVFSDLAFIYAEPSEMNDDATKIEFILKLIYEN